MIQIKKWFRLKKRLSLKKRFRLKKWFRSGAPAANAASGACYVRKTDSCCIRKTGEKPHRKGRRGKNGWKSRWKTAESPAGKPTGNGPGINRREKAAREKAGKKVSPAAGGKKGKSGEQKSSSQPGEKPLGECEGKVENFSAVFFFCFWRLIIIR